MTNLTRDEIIEFASRLEGVRVEREVVGGRECLVVCSDKGGALYTATEDCEAYAWLCGYAWCGNWPTVERRLSALERVAEAATAFAEGLIDGAPKGYPGFRVADHRYCTPVELNWARLRSALSALAELEGR